MQRTVFVSYARKDSDRIQQAVALLEAGGAQVFRDIDDIEFGDDWEAVITRKLQECERVMVFWSENAQASEWVGKEYAIALKQKKRMVPVLLDKTPLPPELSKYHALTNFMPKSPSWKKYGGWGVGAVAMLVLVAVVALPALQQSTSSESLVAENVEMHAPAEADNMKMVRPVPAPAPQAPSAEENVVIDPVSGLAEPPDPVVTAPPERRESSPVFAWGAGLLSLLLLLLFWLRSRSETMAALDNERAGQQFVDAVFDEE